MKHRLWAVCFSVMLAAFTACLALDTFVLRKSYDSSAGALNEAMFSDAGDSASALTLQGDRSGGAAAAGATLSAAVPNADYADENISVTLSEYDEYNTKIYVADVLVSSAQYLKTAFAEDTYGRNITAKTSAIAADNGAVFTVNGDFYGAQEHGYVIRNGIVYRDSARGADVLCIYADGTMEIVSDREYSAAELLEKGVWQAFSFGPGLVGDGEIIVDRNEEVGKAMASNPRTAIGMISANHFVFVVADGRTGESEGLSLYELAAFLKKLGVTTAYNLDGGGSSTMYFNGRVVNKPTANGKIRERGVSDIVYLG